MKVLLVQPSALMFAEVYLRLEPLGLERVASALRHAGHDVRILDLQVFSQDEYFKLLRAFTPQAIGFSLNYLANIPEVLDLAKTTKQLLPGVFIFAGGHSVSFVADEVLDHAQGDIDVILRGEGETATPLLLAAAQETVPGTVSGLETVPGTVSSAGRGPAPLMLHNLDDFPPARDLTLRRHKYFIGHLDPCASVEFTRGCPWDCSFCSAWTFYGRSYRIASVDAIVDDLKRIQEPNAFIVDDVAFIKPDHGMAIADALEKNNIRKQYYLETRADVLIRHPEVFARWARLGLSYMFLGIEALDDEGLKAFRKRTTPNKNFQALDLARKLGIRVAINIIADPAWTPDRFAHLREWAMQVPEIVHVTVQTPYPGTEIWHTESRKLTTLDYRLFDVQHAVLPTTLPLDQFYQELVKTQSILNRKHFGWAVMRQASLIALKLAFRGQTNFLRSLWKFTTVFNADRQLADHHRPVRYAMRPPAEKPHQPTHLELFVHHPAPTPATSPSSV